jgi:hypothetical protein
MKNAGAKPWLVLLTLCSVVAALVARHRPSDFGIVLNALMVAASLFVVTCVLCADGLILNRGRRGRLYLSIFAGVGLLIQILACCYIDDLFVRF